MHGQLGSLHGCLSKHLKGVNACRLWAGRGCNSPPARDRILDQGESLTRPPTRGKRGRRPGGSPPASPLLHCDHLLLLSYLGVWQYVQEDVIIQ